MDYQTAAKAYFELTGLKVGSKVRVTHKVKDRAHGWPNSWAGKMDNFIGKEYTVEHLILNQVSLYDKATYNSYNFPFFVLEVITDGLPKNIPVGDYEAKFNVDKSIVINGVRIPFETLKAIYETAKGTV